MKVNPRKTLAPSRIKHFQRLKDWGQRYFQLFLKAVQFFLPRKIIGFILQFFKRIVVFPWQEIQKLILLLILFALGLLLLFFAPEQLFAIFSILFHVLKLFLSVVDFVLKLFLDRILFPLLKLSLDKMLSKIGELIYGFLTPFRHFSNSVRDEVVDIGQSTSSIVHDLVSGVRALGRRSKTPLARSPAFEKA